MKLHKQKVDTFIVRAMCSECGEELKYEKPSETALMDVFLMGSVAVYTHRCNNGHTENLAKQYPIITYE